MVCESPAESGNHLALPSRVNLLFFRRVRSLSNSPPHRDAAGDRHSQTVYRPVAHAEVDDALRLILATDSKVASDEQVLDFLNFAVHRGMDLNQIRVAEQNSRLVWAVLP